jgi:hypothetical protein
LRARAEENAVLIYKIDLSVRRELPEDERGVCVPNPVQGDPARFILLVEGDGRIRPDVERYPINDGLLLILLDRKLIIRG